MASSPKASPCSTTRLPLYVVNAFVLSHSNALAEGNPAAVVLQDTKGSELSVDTMSRIASQMNLSESAFVSKETTTENVYHIRWFTPKPTEVDLCGHATIGAAIALYTAKLVSIDTDIVMRTKRAGDLQVRVETRASGPFVRLNLPAFADRQAVHTAEAQLVLQALSLPPHTPVQRIKYDIVVNVSTATIVRNLKPDFAALGKVKTRGIAVAAPGDGADDIAFVARFFAPAVAIAEDPATGSMFSILAPLYLEEGAPPRRALQLSGRGASVEVAWCGDHVVLGALAKVVVAGTLDL